MILPKISSCDLDKIGDFEKYSAIINLNDTPNYLFESKTPYFWFPIHETNRFGYAPFFGAAKVWDNFKNKSKPVLFHCASGVNRSVSVAYAILKSDGFSEEEIKLYFPKKSPKFMFDMNIKKGYVYPDVIEFLTARHNYPTYSIM